VLDNINSLNHQNEHAAGNVTLRNCRYLYLVLVVLVSKFFLLKLSEVNLNQR